MPPTPIPFQSSNLRPLLRHPRLPPRKDCLVVKLCILPSDQIQILLRRCPMMGHLYASSVTRLYFSAPVFFLGHDLVTAGGVTEATPLGPSLLQSCVKTFLLSFENHSQNVPLPTKKLQGGNIPAASHSRNLAGMLLHYRVHERCSMAHWSV